MDQIYTKQTTLLDFNNTEIQKLVKSRNWLDLPAYEKIGAAYNFVRDEILFGYNRSDNITASSILADGYGQCNTKGTLLMALLRALSIPCRLHGFTIHKDLQRGIVPEIVYALTPENILHSWVEVWHEERWVNMEGFILDTPFLQALQDKFIPHGENLCGYGAGTNCLSSPPVEWNGKDTYIQQTGINTDLGIFETPDEFYLLHRQSFGWMRELIYRYLVRHWINVRVIRIRSRVVPDVLLATKIHIHK